MNALRLVGRPRTRLGSESVRWWARRPIVKVDPRNVLWAHTPIDWAAVDFYRRRPNGRYRWFGHDGLPCVVRAVDGTLEGRNGKHRALAAIEEGRRWLRVRLYDEQQEIR